MKRKNIYVLIATWQDETREYKKRVIQSEADSIEEMYELFAKEHPEWDTCKKSFDWGEVDLIYYTNVSVFKVSECYYDRSWKAWRDKKRKKRATQIISEEKARDMAEMDRIIEKWGTSALELLALSAESK